MSSPIETLTFGNVFEFMEYKYIFLVSSLKYVYIAKILSDTETKSLEKMLENHLKKGNPIDDIPIFWFVRLSTLDFKGQWAYLAKPYQDASYSKFFKKINTLKIDKKDLEALKKEILSKNTWPELKDLIRDITVDD